MRRTPAGTRVVRRGLGAVAAGALLAALLSIAGADPAGATESCNGLPATHVGTGGADEIEGTDGNDVIVGLGGDDTISGMGGNDTICAGGGNDTVYGESEELVIAAAGGNDTIFGEGGNDLVIGDFGFLTFPTGAGTVGWNDTIDGGGGSDVISGDMIDVTVDVGVAGAVGFADTINGGEGDGADIIYGDAQNFDLTLVGAVALEVADNTINGGGGADTIYGNYESVVTAGVVLGTGWSDTINGNAGGDTIYGDVKFGQDRLVPVAALAFADTVDGGEGSDTADGGPGTDTCTSVENPTNCNP